MLQNLIESGLVAWIALGLLAIEFVGLALYFRTTGRGLSAREVAPTLMAGGAVWVALGAALSGEHWGWIGGAVLVSLAAHLVDLGGRWRR